MVSGRAGTIVESRSFQLFVAAVICINAITIGCETLDVPDGMSLLLSIFDLACLGVYIVEAYLKISAYGNAYFQDGWNIFDFLIVVVSVLVLLLSALAIAVQIPVQVLRTIRLFRVVRLFKLLSMFRKLRVIVEAIGRSIPAVLWTCLLLLIVLYVFDVIGVFVFSAEFPSYFDDLATGMFTMFQIVTLEGWPDIARPIIEAHPLAWLYFVPLVILTAFIMLNIILGIILETIDESRQAERVEPGATEVQLAQELDDLKEQIETVQRLLDKTNAENRK